MYKQKLNPRVFSTFKLITRQKVGLMCMLNLPNSSNKYTNSTEIQRFSRQEEAKLQKTLATSAITLQKNIRSFLAKRKFQILKNQEEFRIKTQKATKIQAHFRGFLSRNWVKFYKVYTKLNEIRNKAAQLIQKNYKLHVLKSRLQVLAVVNRTIQMRASAAKLIQKQVRGYLVRKDLCFVRRKFGLLIFWRYFAKNVFIAGSFTYPPWKIEIPLVYSKYLNGFYSGFFIENKLSPGDYALKFIVDGSWLCDGHYPLFQDSEGNYNNVITITKTLRKIPRSQSLIVFPKHTNRAKGFNIDKSPLILHPYMKSSLLLNENSNIDVEIRFGYSTVNAGNVLKKKEFTFFDEETQSFGIGNGNGNWELVGKDPGEYVFELIGGIQEKITALGKVFGNRSANKEVLLKNILKTVWSEVKSVGSSCVLFGVCVNNVLNFINLGNSRLVVFRRLKNSNKVVKVFASGKKINSFGGKLELISDPAAEFSLKLPKTQNLSLLRNLLISGKPEDSEFFSVFLQPDDILIIVSAGVMNNLYDEDLGGICERFIGEDFTPSNFCDRTAKAICCEARTRGLDSEYRSPYWKEARSAGRIGVGGKLGEFSAVVGLCVERNQKRRYT